MRVGAAIESPMADDSFRQKLPPGIVGSVYVVKTLEAALWAFHNAEDFP